ncbi:hypothetical protein ZIOFF_048694 [Zingiber officinale]|uniref:pyridoxal kinase n=2 Tax=Magnoliopsida TaxID=3398 RepID=A0A8J5KUG8_ZINOF|nr:hypothetical protein ZIOFF_048694 [Zingiber officinale]
MIRVAEETFLCLRSGSSTTEGLLLNMDFKTELKATASNGGKRGVTFDRPLCLLCRVTLGVREKMPKEKLSSRVEEKRQRRSYRVSLVFPCYFFWLILGFNRLWRQLSRRSAMARPPILSLALPSETGRVLSIQSHTVQVGYVGNKSAVFPLQLLGYDVDPINSVQFSNHTGKMFYIISFQQSQDQRAHILCKLLRALIQQHRVQKWLIMVAHYSSIVLLEDKDLPGYIGSISFLDVVLQVVERLRSVNPGLVYGNSLINLCFIKCEMFNLTLAINFLLHLAYLILILIFYSLGSNVLIILTLVLIESVCDPVMGDEGKLYVPRNLVSVYREKVVPVASMLTPNQFEVELLTGVSITSESDGREACNILHAAGPSKVVITSLNITDKLLLIGSHQKVKGQPPKQFKIVISKIPAYFTGTGDLMTALLLGWSNVRLHFTKYPDNLEKASELAVSSLQALLRRTLADYKAAGFDPQSSSLEIRLIQSQDDIRNPEAKFKAESFNH